MIVPPHCSCLRPISLLEVIAGVIFSLIVVVIYHKPELLNTISSSLGRVLLSFVIFFFVMILVYYLPRYGRGVNK